MKFCSSCGQRLGDECNVCPVCGESAQTAESFQKNPYDAEKYTHGAYVRVSYAKPTVTYLFIAINVLVFALIHFVGEGCSLANVLSMHRGAVASGQYYRIITSIFTHESLQHLFSNCYALLIYGMILEPALGKPRYILLYFSGGIVGNLLTYALMSNPSIGASGAIFGLLGAIVAIHYVRPTAMSRGMMRNIIFCVVITTVFGIGGNVNNLAHFGGMLGGYVVTCLFIKERMRKRLYTSRPVCAVFLAALLVFTAVKGTVSVSEGYEKHYGDYTTMVFLASIDKYAAAVPYAEEILRNDEVMYGADAAAVLCIDSADRGDKQGFVINFAKLSEYSGRGSSMMSRDIWERIYEVSEKMELTEHMESQQSEAI